MIVTFNIKFIHLSSQMYASTCSGAEPKHSGQDLIGNKQFWKRRQVGRPCRVSF